MSDVSHFSKLLSDHSLANKEVSDSGLKVGWVLDTLLARNDDFRRAVGSGKVKDVTSDDISEGKGYMSVIYRCAVHFVDENQPAYNFIMKVPCMRYIQELISDEKGQDTKRSFLTRAHNGECEFYESFKDVADVPIPKVWYTRRLDDAHSEPGVIIMEDLSEKGVNPGLTASVTLEQIKNLTRHLAALHTHVLCSDVDTKRMEGLAFYTEMDMEDLKNMFAKELIETDPAFEPLVAKLEPFSNCAFSQYALYDRPKEIGMPLIFCHGDMWMNNLLFEKSDDGAPSNRILAIIDWQTIIHGNPMLDLARFIGVCADAEVRREAEHENFIIKFYYDELAKRMAVEGKTPPFSVEQLTEAYKLALLLQAVEAIAAVPFCSRSIREAEPERISEAKIARLALRCKLLLEDAADMVDEVAKTFIKKESNA